MNESILVTGGSGLLALNWAATVRNRYNVLLARHQRPISLAGAVSCNPDLTSVDELVALLDREHPRMLVHTVACTSAEACEADPQMAYCVNVTLAENVARACARTGVPLVQISSDHLFGGDRQMLDEAEPPAPQNVYGKTKAEAECRVLEICPDALVVRTNFYGWGPSYRRSFSDAILDALRSGKPLTLFTDVYYTPILMETLVLAVHDLVDMGARGIVHAVGDERISKFDFGRQVAAEFNLDAAGIAAGRMVERANLVRRPLDMSLSNAKVRTLLGRDLGDVRQQLARLHQLERDGLAREMLLQ